jgi:hypothetical protein
MAYVSGTPRVYPEADIKGDLPNSDEPTRVVDGKTEVGAIDLKSGLDANVAKDADKAHRDLQKSKEQRNRYSANNPHLNTPYSTLETLTFQALRRYGDMHPGTVDGEVMMMFVEFGNLIIEDLRGHPYWENPEMDYYTHPSEVRAIPDNIIVAGLLYHYSVQQQSNKIEAYGPMYFKMMNRILYQKKYGSGKIEVSPWDKSQRPEGQQGYDVRRA